MKHEEYMAVAIEEAKLAFAEGEVPVGAAVVKDGRVVGRGHNRREQSGDPTAHAELEALRSAAQSLGEWQLQGCTLYVTLEPCPMCAGALCQARIARVIFGAFDPKAGYCGSLYNLPADSRLPHRAEVLGGLLEEECAELLSRFFQERRAL